MNRLYNYSCAQYRQFSLECAPGITAILFYTVYQNDLYVSYNAVPFVCQISFILRVYLYRGRPGPGS